MLSICYKSRMENKLEIKLDRTWKTESFICKYTSKDIKFAKGKDEWKNNPTTNLNILYAKKEKIYPVYVSKHNSNCENKLFF